METVNMLWITGGLAFCSGLVTGVVIIHFLGASLIRNNQLRQQLNKTEAELNEYKEKVADHFSTTAHLVNRMTESYRDVHEHIASSANELCADELTRQRLSDALLSSNTLLMDGHNGKTSPMVEPPRDYALKNNSEKACTPGTNGTWKTTDNI